MSKMDFEIGKFYYLSTDGYKFKYRRDKYNPYLIHVELFNRLGGVVHKQIACGGYGISMNHHETINELEAKILLNQLDSTGLKQTV